MKKEEFDALVVQFGEAAAKQMKAMKESLENDLNEKYAAVVAGSITRKQFDDELQARLKELNETIEKLESAAKAQGTKITEMEAAAAKPAVGGKSMEEFLGTQIEKIKALRAAGAGTYEITSEDLIKAGVTHFGRKAATAYGVSGTGTISDMSPTAGNTPYLPGLGGSDLELFEVIRNPNFIINRIDLGTTNQRRLAWIDEVDDFQGTVGTAVAEGGTKPLTQHKFIVRFSDAKKAAAYIILSEEFEDDLPGLATAVRRMLQADVLRAFDDQIQADVIAAATPYQITGLDGVVPFATLFDAIGAELAQVGFYNFIPNTVALNPVTNWRMLMDKDVEGRYYTPPFLARINNLLVEATKVAVGYGLVGDLSQFKVDIYKQFSLRIGWINEQLITNQFCIVGELRYHDYISTNRKKAIVYAQLTVIMNQIAGGSHN